MPMLKFLIYTILGSAIWNTVLIIIGNRVGENWESILAIFDKYSLVVVILLIIIFIGFIIWFYKFRKSSKKSKTM